MTHECWLTQTLCDHATSVVKYQYTDKSRSSEKKGLSPRGQWVWNDICSHCCMLLLHGYLNSIICPTLENSRNKHWALQIFPEIYHKHKTWYFIRNPDIDVKKTIDGPFSLTSAVSVTRKNSYISHRYLTASNFVSVELKINSFSPLLVLQGPYTILKDL